jgi:hypothetical protein
LELERNLAETKLKQKKIDAKREADSIPPINQENDKIELHIKRCYQKREKIDEECIHLVESLAILAKQFVQ